MRARLRSVLTFALVFLALLPISVVLYGWVLPDYQRLVLAIANTGLELFGHALQIERDPAGTWTLLLNLPGHLQARNEALDPHALDVIWLNLALLPPLLLATPVSLLARLRLLLAGAVLLVACHVLGIAALVYGWRCVAVGPGGSWCDWVGWTVKIHGQLLGGVQWAILTWGSWFRLLAPGESAPDRVRAGRGRKARRRAPAPTRRAHAR